MLKGLNEEKRNLLKMQKDEETRFKGVGHGRRERKTKRGRGWRPGEEKEDRKKTEGKKEKSTKVGGENGTNCKKTMQLGTRKDGYQNAMLRKDKNERKYERNTIMR